MGSHCMECDWSGGVKVVKMLSPASVEAVVLVDVRWWDFRSQSIEIVHLSLIG